MIILTSPAGFLEIAIFLFAVTALVLAIRFFINSRKRLQETFPGIINPRKQLQYGFDRSGFLIPKPSSKKTETQSQLLYQPTKTVTPDYAKDDMKDVRLQLRQQQQELAKALQQIADLSQNVASSEHQSVAVAQEQKKLVQLQATLEKKEAEIQRLKGQDLYTQKLHERLDDVQYEFDKLQEKMTQMEKQAWQAAELSIQLEHAEESQLQAEKSMLKKEEKLRELTLENQQLREALGELEDKLSEANLQRQQLRKKVQLLEGLNNDMVQMAETNRKLKTEIARMAELESMLQMMTEGKDNR